MSYTAFTKECLGAVVLYAWRQSITIYKLKRQRERMGIINLRKINNME